MIAKPMDVLEQFPVRKSKKQKEAFRSDVTAYLESLGYSVTTEKGYLGARNVVAGNPETAKYLVTAHYDTCARMIVPNLITPCNVFLFALYQILLVALMIVPALVVTVLVGYFTRSVLFANVVFQLILWTSIFMMMVGPANRTNANDNTSGVVSVLEIAASLPENLRDKVCFVLFDLEEAGLWGSMGYRSKHKKASDSQMVLNLDCVGEGDYIYFFPTAKLKKDAAKLKPFEKLCGTHGRKSISLRKKGFSVYPSDQSQFPYGVGICALRRGKLGLYMSKIHTSKDTVLEETNVNILRAALISLIGGTSVE